MTIDDYTNTDICKKCRFYNDKQCLGTESDEIHCYYYLIEMLPQMQTVEAKPVRNGRWMFHVQKNGYLWKCSNCKGNFDQRFSYCPHCGARMTGGNA